MDLGGQQVAAQLALPMWFCLGSSLRSEHLKWNSKKGTWVTKGCSALPSSLRRWTKYPQIISKTYKNNKTIKSIQHRHANEKSLLTNLMEFYHERRNLVDKTWLIFTSERLSTLSPMTSLWMKWKYWLNKWQDELKTVQTVRLNGLWSATPGRD